MATLIPSITTCKFDSSGEGRFARLLEAKLEDDYLCWYNVPPALAGSIRILSFFTLSVAC